MILRLVSPVLRPGSKNHQLVKRVPSAIRERMIGRRLSIPCGGGVVAAKVDPRGVIRCSLRTCDPNEARARQGEAQAYLERLFASEESSRPLTLSRAQAVAFSRVIYEGWASEKRERTIAVEAVADPSHPRDVRVVRVDPIDDEDGSEEAGAFGALAKQLTAAHGDSGALERLLGPIIRAELPKVLPSPVAPASCAMLLEEFRAALLQAAELRNRRAGGVDEEGRRVLPDYSADPMTNPWEFRVRRLGGCPSRYVPIGFVRADCFKNRGHWQCCWAYQDVGLMGGALQVVILIWAAKGEV